MAPRLAEILGNEDIRGLPDQHCVYDLPHSLANVAVEQLLVVSPDGLEILEYRCH